MTGLTHMPTDTFQPRVTAQPKPATVGAKKDTDMAKPAAEPYRLAFLGPDGETFERNVPEDTCPGWDAMEAAVLSATTGIRYRPAGRTRRGGGRPIDLDGLPGVIR